MLGRSTEQSAANKKHIILFLCSIGKLLLLKMSKKKATFLPSAMFLQYFSYIVRIGKVEKAAAFHILHSVCMMHSTFCLYGVFYILSVWCVLHSVHSVFSLYGAFCILYEGGLVQLHFPPNPSPAVSRRPPSAKS